MYLEVTTEVGHRIAAGFFTNPLFMTRLEVRTGPTTRRSISCWTVSRS
jgi:hypothetical protein